MSEKVTSMAEARKKFLISLSDCVHEGIRNILGPVALEAVLSKLQSSSLSESPEDLENGFGQIFGSSAKILEKLIVKDLFKRLNLKFEEVIASFDFETYVNIARREFSMNWMKETTKPLT